MENKNERLLRYLNDAYATEVGGLMALKDLLLVVADQPEIKAAVEQHIAVTETQAERLTNRILNLGGDKSEPKAIVNSVLAKGSSFLNIFHNKQDKMTQDLIKAYAFERFEIGSYLALRTYAESIGDQETALLAAQIIDEERTASDMLERFIPAASVQAAMGTSDMNGESEKSGLSALPPAAALIVPGAILAAWGVSKWLSHRNENRFATATIAPDLQYSEVTVAVLEPSMADLGVEGGSAYAGENAYQPIAFEDEMGEDLASGDLNERE
jgi:ferritin-like metal-binding protein YciE